MTEVLGKFIKYDDEKIIIVDDDEDDIEIYYKITKDEIDNFFGKRISFYYEFDEYIKIQEVGDNIKQSFLGFSSNNIMCDISPIGMQELLRKK